MFRKILIANRGEIAVTVIRACRELGIQSVAVFSEADRDALHVHLADEAVCIGPAEPRLSYLNPQAILSACTITGADAIHPGFGFLSENADFARMCEKCQVTFIGPKPETMDRMGDKNSARRTAKENGIPITPGSNTIIDNPQDAMRVAEEIGYPVMVKATSGGGGRGMRIAQDASELPKAFRSAQMEAESAFGNRGVYLERYLVNPRHIEFQIMGDNYGNIVHLGERDCSLQRRNQKMLEEAGSPGMNDELRNRMGRDSVRLAKAVGYIGAGTIEYLVDAQDNYYFMEMNTRIQVEHPVTEAITGVNLICEQIRVAAGVTLSFRQKDIQFNGHSIECRINAEDPLLDFRPSAGTIENLILPGGIGVRIDTAVYHGYTIPSEYDSMIAKIIVYGPDRRTCIRRMRRALAETALVGVPTNIDFHIEILRDPDFIAGKYDIGYLSRKMPQFLAELESAGA